MQPVSTFVSNPASGDEALLEYRGARKFLRGLLREFGAGAVTVALSLLSIALSVLSGLVVTPLFIGPVTLGTVLVTVVIPAVVAPPIILLSMRLLHELDGAERRLQQISAIDELTQAYSRRHLLHALKVAFARSRRYGEELSVLMMDVDHFKRVNDVHGHQVGDQALVETVRRIGSALRTVDVLARYGGEEFVALLPNTTLEGASILAERVRTAVGSLPLQTSRGDLAVTVSIGVGALEKSDPDVDGLLRRADDGLYQAKAEGRNRVVVGKSPGGDAGPAPA